MENEITGEVPADELELINGYTKRNFSADEVYTFSVVLCDNEIDREYECFDGDALGTLAEMYIGKSGILDHNPTAQNQTARIYKCEAETIAGRKTSYGALYKRIRAKAYLPRSENNRDLILALDSGIRKEVSVGCSMGSCTCSICGENMIGGSCAHIKGKRYGERLCYGILGEPRDAYEWSFVAVPAQREAGVVKSFQSYMKGDKKMEDVFKKLDGEGEVTLTKSETKELLRQIDNLRQKAHEGELYRRDIEEEMTRLCSIAEPELSIETIKSVASRMTIEELKAFKKVYERRTSNMTGAKPQLAPSEGMGKPDGNNAYTGI